MKNLILTEELLLKILNDYLKEGIPVISLPNTRVCRWYSTPWNGYKQSRDDNKNDNNMKLIK